jgi:molybdopterin-guanine dinucleotide biosynthesis protein A
MGQDKALVPFLGQRLIERVIDRVKVIADELFVVANRPADYTFLGLPVVEDQFPGRGALGGLYTALFAALHPAVAVVACDMPFACAPLLAAQQDRLVAAADAVIPRTDRGAEPFHAVYRRETCLSPIKWAIESGQWRADAWHSRVHVIFLDIDEIGVYDPHRIAFLNINTSEDLKSAETLATRLNV